MDANYFYKQGRAVSAEFIKRRNEINDELGLGGKDGYLVRYYAAQAGELPLVTDATSMDDYMDKYRALMTDWQHSQTVIENDTFSERLTSKWHQRDRNIRPHEQVVLKFPTPSADFD